MQDFPDQIEKVFPDWARARRDKNVILTYVAGINAKAVEYKVRAPTVLSPNTV